MKDLPELAEVLPQSGPMRLLDRIVEHGGGETVCELDVDAQALFRRADGSLPAWVALEYMAQCVAAHAGLVARERGEPRPALGLFLGARRTRLGVDSLPAGATLRVRARHAASSSEGLQAFDCTVEAPDAGAALVEARLSLLVPRDLESFLRGARAGARREGES